MYLFLWLDICEGCFMFGQCTLHVSSPLLWQKYLDVFCTMIFCDFHLEFWHFGGLQSFLLLIHVPSLSFIWLREDFLIEMMDSPGQDVKSHVWVPARFFSLIWKLSAACRYLMGSTLLEKIDTCRFVRQMCLCAFFVNESCVVVEIGDP